MEKIFDRLTDVFSWERISAYLVERLLPTSRSPRSCSWCTWRRGGSCARCCAPPSSGARSMRPPQRCTR